MKIIFIGCVEIGLKCLKQILKDGWEVIAIFTLAKKYAAKTSGFVDFSPLAKKRRISLYKIKDMNEEKNINRIRNLKPNLIIISGWQRLICKEILDIPIKGAIGFHSSLLPKYRGRAPVNWAIINGEKKTGVTLFYCKPEADSGDIIAQKSFPITLMDNCATAYNKSAKAACQLLHIYLPKIEKGTVRKIKNKSAKYKFWPKRNPEDGRIDWNKSALRIHNFIRALTHPYPGAFAYYGGRKYFICKSKLTQKKTIRSTSAFKKEPGKILDIKRRGNKLELLIATKDRPIVVTEIKNEGNGTGCEFSKGERFI